MAESQLINFLNGTMSADYAVRKQAEEMVLNSETTQEFVPAMFGIACRQDVALAARMAAVLALKNCVRRRWAPDEPDIVTPMSDRDREFLKANIVPAMLPCDLPIRRQFVETISLIGKHDFPEKWPDLINTLKQHCLTTNFEVIDCILSVASALFKHYQVDMKSNKLWTEIKYVLDNMAADLTNLMQSLMNEVKKAYESMDKDALNVLLECLHWMADIFCSLNSQDLPEFFEDNLTIWMNAFVEMLNFNFEKMGKVFAADRSNVVERIKAQVIDNLTLFTQKYMDEFGPYISAFIPIVWMLLVNASVAERNDSFVVNGMRFLSTVALKAEYNKPFADPETMRRTCNEIILKNMELRSCDVDLIDTSPEEFVEQDIGGSDFETRRRGACDFVKALCVHFETDIMTLLSQQVQTLLTQYKVNPDANWMQMDAAIYLVIAIGSRGQTAKHGVTKLSQFFDPNVFYSDFLKSELERPSGVSMLKADVIKYLIVYRGVLHKQVVLESLPRVVPLLIDDTPLVRMYCAHLIECLLVYKNPMLPTQHLYSKEDLAPYLYDVVTLLVRCMEMDDTEECVYIIRCMMRMLATFSEQMATAVNSLFNMFLAKLVQVSKNPCKPQFNHCLFEVLCLLCQIMSKADMSSFLSMEAKLLEVFQEILQKDISDFVPYVFQMLSLMLDLRHGKQSGIPQPYCALYPALLSESLWERSGYIPAMVRLLQSYFRLDGAKLFNENMFTPVLDIFNRLVQMKTKDQWGVQLMFTVINSVTPGIIQPYCSTILTITLRRLHSMKTDKFASLFVTLFCLLLGKLRSNELIKIVENVQAGLFAMVLEKIVVPQIGKVPKEMMEVKIRVIGLLELIVDCPLVVSGQLKSLWPSLANGVMLLLSQEASRSEEAEEVVEMPAIKQDFDAVYSLLSYSKVPLDVAPADLNGLVAVAFQRLKTNEPTALAALRSQCPMELQIKLDVFLNA